MMLKIATITLAGGAATLAGALGIGSQDCCSAPVEQAAASFEAPRLYVEARDATVWGGACHVSAQVANGGSRALCAWDFGDARVVLAVEGSHNLQRHEVFNAGEAPAVRIAAWVDAPGDDAAEAALARAADLAPGLPAPASIERAPITMSAAGGGFEVAVDGVLRIAGEDVPDHACCTMPESRWYAPLATSLPGVEASVVGFASECRFLGSDSQDGWSYEGENSVFIARAPAPSADA